MTKRVFLAASALALSVACGSEDPVTSEPNTGDAGTASLARDASRPDASKENTGKTTDPSTPPQRDAGPTNTRDLDGDGISAADGDCDDSDPKISPAAFDFPGDDVDDDCSGSAAAMVESCDQSLAIDSSDAKDAARALGLCNFADENSKAWGVVSARFTDASGSGKLSDPRAVGLLPRLGAAKPSEGSALLALSSGVARAPDQSGYTPACDELDSTCALGGLIGCGGGAMPPAGYPKESSSCHSDTGIFSLKSTIYNQAALELKIRVPNNVSSFAFDSIFYTYEYPDFVCSNYNDFYVVFKDPKPPGVNDGNIVFDTNGDPIGVNTGLLAVCDPSAQSAMATKKFACGQGTALLKDTGFGPMESSCASAPTGGGSTGWLHTTAPAEKGQIITLRFVVWDTNDPDLDSTVLVDKFIWSASDDQVATEPVIVL